MKGYVITVEFDVEPAQFAAFMKLMMENAGASLRDEAAFEAHLQSTHFRSFAAATKDMITARKIIACDLVP